jgi:hypothetical protein
MTFQEVLAQVIAWLQREQRVSYRVLKWQLDVVTTIWRSSKTNLST